MEQQDQKSPESPTGEARSLLVTELRWFAARFKGLLEGGQKSKSESGFDDQGSYVITTVPTPRGYDGEQRKDAIEKLQGFRRQILWLFGKEADVAIDSMSALNMAIAAFRCSELPEKNQIGNLQRQLKYIAEQIEIASLAQSPDQDNKRGAETKAKRSAAKGKSNGDTDSRALIVAALNEHHQYHNGRCEDVGHVGVNKLARHLDISSSTVSAFFKQEFGSHNKYPNRLRQPRNACQRSQNAERRTKAEHSV